MVEHMILNHGVGDSSSPALGKLTCELNQTMR